jgi:hypothetical protein
VVVSEPQRAFYGNQLGNTFPLFTHYQAPVPLQTRRMVLDLEFYNSVGSLVALADHAAEYLPPPDWAVQRGYGLGFLLVGCVGGQGGGG